MRITAIWNCWRRIKKPMSTELASAINDGLYLYEQENNDPRDEITRSSGAVAALSKSKNADHSCGGKNNESAGNSNSRRKQNKGFAKPHTIHKQRLFSGNHRNHGISRNTAGTGSESPPSDSVGFFFGSTPPDSHVYKKYHKHCLSEHKKLGIGCSEEKRRKRNKGKRGEMKKVLHVVVNDKCSVPFNF